MWKGLALNPKTMNPNPKVWKQVTERLASAGLPAVRQRLAALLAAAERGVLANPTVSPQDLLLFMHTTLSGVLAAEEAAAVAVAADAEAAVGGHGWSPVSLYLDFHQTLLFYFFYLIAFTTMPHCLGSVILASILRLKPSFFCNSDCFVQSLSSRPSK